MMQLKRRIQLAFFASTLAGGALFLYLFYSVKGFFALHPANFPVVVLALVASNATGVGMFFLSRFLNRMAPWHLATALRFVVELVVMGLFTVLLNYTLLRGFLWWQNLDQAAFYLAYHDLLVKIFILGVVVIFIYTILDFTLYSYNQYAALQIEAVKVNRTQLALQLEVLKSQLSPHYLFNSLNTISALMYRDPELAEQFIRKLAHTYQYILTTQNQELVLLREELQFLEAYFFLLKARFESAVELTLDLPRRTWSSRIPPLTLQLLLENAVKHNVPTDESPLNIRIFLSDPQHLCVSNNILTGGSRWQSFKVGLDNIRLRYRYFAQADISVRREPDFQVILPLLYNQPVPA